MDAALGNDRWLVTDASHLSSVSLLLRLAPIKRREKINPQRLVKRMDTMK
jgi:hypothetical protein